MTAWLTLPWHPQPNTAPNCSLEVALLQALHGVQSLGPLVCIRLASHVSGLWRRLSHALTCFGEDIMRIASTFARCSIDSGGTSLRSLPTAELRILMAAGEASAARIIGAA